MQIKTINGGTITNAIWFTPPCPIAGVEACIGIVTVKTNIGDEKKYIGFGFGKDEEYDARIIAENGSPFYGG